MSLLARLGDLLGDAFEQVGADPSFGAVEWSNRPDLGQFQCNGALAAAKSLGRNPREIAQHIVDLLPAQGVFADVSIAGPGFINLTLDDTYLADVVQEITDDDRLGYPTVSAPRKHIIDFGGPNVAKSMHVGHVRSTVIGDSLQRLLRFVGHPTESDIHLGDWGTPMGMLIVELQRRQPDLVYFDPAYTGPYPETSPVTLEDLEEMYPAAAARVADDPAEAEKARQATQELQSGRPGYRALWQHFVDVSIAGLKENFDALGVHFDHWFGESTVHDRIEPILRRIETSGVARRSDGALVIDVARPDDTMDIPPLLLVKSDGSYLYGTTDLATIEMRVQDQHAKDILYVVDARQSLHFTQVFRAARIAGIAPDDVALEHVGFGTVNGPDGKPFKTRAGGLMRLSDLIHMVIEAAERRLAEAEIAQDYPVEERHRIARAVGVAALKFGDLSNHRMSNYVFDLDRFVSFEGRTGPYLQYSAVRIRSILRNATERGLRPGPVAAATVDAERDLMLTLTKLPEVLDRTVELRAPNHVAEYAYDVSTVFNRFYDRCHILREPDPARQASWLALVRTTLDLLVLLLDLLGIEVPERM